MPGVRRVIVGVSGSLANLPAVRSAAAIADHEGVPLVAVHAWVPPRSDPADPGHPALYGWRLWEDAARQRLRMALEAAWENFPSDLDQQLVTLCGEAGQVLVQTACAGDLLVVGAGRGGGMARIWHGAVSRYCQARACCPVLSIPPPALTGAGSPA